MLCALFIHFQVRVTAFGLEKVHTFSAKLKFDFALEVSHWAFFSPLATFCCRITLTVHNIMTQEMKSRNAFIY